ncbi:DUF1659 domain-containing protein [uncultured Clostridium sp.]|uniref:DUF1659 domain-containing protein n=1 Tax=uncultured Clostridium sp. TaxID=59620 RepID=UPI0025D10A9B|nr:DUF1659 domain-containing protein [uncultured Clostridium sp.]
MAASKVIQNTSLSFEIESGTDSNGNATYSKKTLSNLRADADTDAVLDVFDAMASVLSASTRDCFINESSKIVRGE